ncbi:uncharacterized protein LOC115634399 [Scaptodrosophila lebanonensis]|uniref:Uncharacterized protein LOC115634399 n=1 Tax=Drosophila lebanonensis TaxID=7225 RepID=A0A6J2UIF0_DROLE|nr:uncharacterized protein LOC115634399 [Scaptodrosophila lebanonensis]
MCTQIGGTRMLKFTNVKCMDLPTNNGFSKYDFCRLKVVGRNCVELSLKCSLLNLPITNLTTQMQLFQRRDGYRPYLYNVYFDFCKLMNNMNRGFSLERYIFGAVRKNSNFNQTCPWTENYMSVDKFALNFTKIDLPVPTGYYRFDFTFYSYGIPRTLTQVYFEKVI